MPFSAPVTLDQRYARPHTSMPSAMVIITKKIPVVRTASKPNTRDTSSVVTRAMATADGQAQCDLLTR